AADWITHQEATISGYSGHVQQARAISRHAADLARQAGTPERAASYEAAVAVREAFFGNAAEARQRAEGALSLSKARDVEYGAALALSLVADFKRAQALSDDLENRFPNDTNVKFSYTPILRAELALGSGDAARALQELQIS